jgi:hypothetical protein
MSGLTSNGDDPSFAPDRSFEQLEAQPGSAAKIDPGLASSEFEPLDGVRAQTRGRLLNQGVIHPRVPPVLPLDALDVDVCGHRRDRRRTPPSVQLMFTLRNDARYAMPGPS